jgi:two-component system response regulator/two-component system chemotaxis response regulator CheY
MSTVSAKKRIIFADDEDDIREIFTMALTSNGFEVFEAKNGEEVFEWLNDKTKEFVGIVLDVIMPVMDGFEVLERMQKNDDYKKIPVIVTSNLSSDADRQEAFALGAKDFLEKAKMTPSSIANKVKELLEKRS